MLSPMRAAEAFSVRWLPGFPRFLRVWQDLVECDPVVYMLVWSWSEHVPAAEQLGVKVTGQIILLFDEIDAHLHPRWQRAIVPAILKVMDRLTNRGAGVQLIAATHSPLVLASVEPHFDEACDGLFHLDIRDGWVVLDTVPWAAQGDALKENEKALRPDPRGVEAAGNSRGLQIDDKRLFVRAIDIGTGHVAAVSRLGGRPEVYETG